MKHMTRKATRHVNQNEGLIFEKSSPGKAAWRLPPLDVPDIDASKLLGSTERKDLGQMPEVSEIEIIRHFTRLSTWNYAIDLGMYPLGSCTMKYNPRVNEVVARFDGLANGHPYQPERVSQGALRIMKTLSECLTEITGMDAITLQPAAGAHGELTGLLIVRAYQQSKGNPRKKILIPDSAHGTNPATAAMVGYAVENLKSNARGMVDITALEAQMNELLLPKPVVITKPDGALAFEYNRPQSVGRVRAFYGNFGMFVRALAYILANGPDGLRQTTEDAVLNANYIRKGLEGVYDLPYSTPTMHEVVFSDKLQAKKVVKTMDIAKRLIDYGFHPYTTAFPLIEPGDLMIEPTESESKEELDLFIEAMRAIAQEVEEDAEVVRTAPHSTRVARLDETAAARKPILRWKPSSEGSQTT